MANDYFPDSFKDIYGDSKGGAQDYQGTFGSAYTALDQPGGSAGHEQVIAQGTYDLAHHYIQAIHDKTGKIPSADEVKQFVAQNLTQDFAKKYITGQLNGSNIGAQVVQPYLQNKEFENSLKNPNAPLSTASQLDSIYAPLQNEAVRQVNAQFSPLRSRAVEEEAALGRLRSPVSADASSPIGQVDTNQGNALSSVIGNILSQKATGTLDLTKFNEGLDLSKQQLGQAQNQFNQTLGFNKQTYADQQDLQKKQLDLAKYLGQLQAGNNQPGILDYINTGAKVAGGGASLLTAFKA